MNGRNFFRLLELRPGVVTIPGLSSASSSSNGRRLGADVILIEGMTQFDMAMPNNIINGAGKGSSGDASAQIPIDAIQEFNTQQNPPAEYGWRDGSVVNVGIKSGTNSSARHGLGIRPRRGGDRRRELFYEDGYSSDAGAVWRHGGRTDPQG